MEWLQRCHQRLPQLQRRSKESSKLSSKYIFSISIDRIGICDRMLVLTAIDFMTLKVMATEHVFLEFELQVRFFKKIFLALRDSSVTVIVFFSEGFQKLDKIKDVEKQRKQLEELTGKMRDVKRFAPHFHVDLTSIHAIVLLCVVGLIASIEVIIRFHDDRSENSRSGHLLCKQLMAMVLCTGSLKISIRESKKERPKVARSLSSMLLKRRKLS